MSIAPSIVPVLCCACLVASAHAEEPAPSPARRLLPLPLALGGTPGFWGPSPGTADLAAHLRGTMLFGTDRPGAPALSLRWNLGASISLWRWTEAGVRFSGRWELEKRQHAPGPVELWLRAGPPENSVLGRAALQAVIEHAAGRGGFDEAGRLWTSTTNVGAAVAARPWRLRFAGSLTYERAEADGAPAVYQGLRAGAGLWLAAAKAGEYLGLDVGGDALVRIGGTEGPRGALDVAAVFTVGVRLIDDVGAAFRLGYGQGYGPGMPARFGVAGVGWSYGRGYRYERTTPALIDQLWDWMAEGWARRTSPGFGPLWLPPPAVAPDLHRPPFSPGGALCGLTQSPALLPPAPMARDCVIGGPPVVLSYGAPQVAGWRETTEGAGWVARQGGHALFYGAAGIGCGVVEGLAAGFRCYDVQDGAYQLGRGLGQLGAGAAQLVLGGGGEVAGLSLNASGVGALAGVPVSVASGVLVGNGLRAVRGGAREVTEAVISAMTRRPPPPQQTPVSYVPERASMSEAAERYQAGASGARPGQAPSLPRGGERIVRFDGFEERAGELIDRKRKIALSPKMINQAQRQSEALRLSGRRGWWEVPTEGEARRARALLERAGVTNISVRVVPE